MEENQAVPSQLPYYDEQNGRCREINIRQLNRGYVVAVGCHSFAFSTKDEMLPILINYINDPVAQEKMFREGILFEEQISASGR